VEIAPFGEANTSSTLRKISLTYMEGEGHYHAHKSPSFLSILSQVKAIRSFPYHIFRSVLNVILSGEFQVHGSVHRCNNLNKNAN